MVYIELSPPVSKKTSAGKISFEPDPNWTVDSLISELSSLEIKATLRSPSSSPILGIAKSRADKIATEKKGRAFSMYISDDDFEDSAEESDDRYEKPKKKGMRFSFPEADFSDSESSSDEELHLERPQISLMDKKNLSEEFLLELEREQQLRIKEEIRRKKQALESELKSESKRSLLAINQLEKQTQIKKEIEMRMDKQYQRKIAETLDSHLSLIQRDHEQRSQIEERRIKQDAALEEAKRREKALLETRLQQAKVEAEAKQEAARKAEEKRQADLEASRLLEAKEREKDIKPVPPENMRIQKPEEILSIGAKPEVALTFTSTDFVVKVADSAKQAAAERIAKHDKGLELYNRLLSSSDQDFDKYQRLIARQIRQLTGTVESVRTKSNELCRILKDTRCPHPVSLMVFAKKVLNLCENPGASFNGVVFAVGQVIVRVTSQVPETVDYLLAEFHKACIYTVPQFVQYSKNMNRAKEYQKLIGYREEDGQLESTDSYLDRIESYMKLYGVLVQTDIRDVPNPHGLKEGWMWLARFLNVLPITRFTAVALEAFLKVAGYGLFQKYKLQFMKLIRIISNRVLPALRNKSQSDPNIHRIITKLEIYLDQKLYLIEPPGRRLETTLSSRIHMA